MTENTEFDTLWLSGGNSHTNHSNMTKGTSPESWTPRLGNRVYLGSICVVIVVVLRGGRKRAFGAKNTKLPTAYSRKFAPVLISLHAKMIINLSGFFDSD